MNETTLLYVMTAFVIISAIALCIQAGMLAGIYKTTKALQEKIDPLLPKVDNLVAKATSTVEQSSRQITEITSRTNDILDSTKRPVGYRGGSGGRRCCSRQVADGARRTGARRHVEPRPRDSCGGPRWHHAAIARGERDCRWHSGRPGRAWRAAIGLRWIEPPATKRCLSKLCDVRRSRSETAGAAEFGEFVGVELNGLDELPPGELLR